MCENQDGARREAEYFNSMDEESKRAYWRETFFDRRSDKSGARNNALTVGDLKRALNALPDDMEITAKPLRSERWGRRGE